jgi:hypothetical protein
VAFREEAGGVRERSPAAVYASWTAGTWARAGLIAGLVGVFLTVSGAFGTGAFPLWLRAVYWIGLLAAGTPIAWLTFAALARTPGIRDRRWAFLGMGTLVMAGAYTLVVWTATRALSPAGGGMGLAALFPIVLMVSAAMTALNVLVHSRRGAEPGPSPASAPTRNEPRFLKRLPPRLQGAALEALEAEDHYLRAHTDRGSDLILCRMADAVAELEGVEGLRTHRSWWVARSAVVRVAKADGRAALTLRSGVEAPVSRAAMAALREAGWL